MQYVTASGAAVLPIGLGTFQVEGEACSAVVAEALKVGYRHIDTAAAYGNEAAVGAGLRAASVDRGDVFLTTKVWWTRLGEVERSLEESLGRLDTPYVDLFLIHWPNPAIPLAETLAGMARTKRSGLARNIGISNFTIALMKEAVALSPEPLLCNQIEVHPYLDQDRVIAAARDLGLAVTAYSPIARGALIDDPAIARIAAAHGRTTVQVALRYLVQKDLTVIPRTAKVARVAENFALFDFELSASDMQVLGSLARADGRKANPGWAPAWD
ncbi:aldo/keto reductase [Aquabacter spiritensis]|uniref:Diketogulonate reductase-like aldo/keto reductase n=1 Tax=Aquabacter spiritensis TaxID=933073 RepID=A0A4R3LRQ6_9HYPH|nr:aldo/keto reductase [Aquabacter spiritensis]TCT02436.1 diketogulonate reductase-like aldo/keto reductase [Aquabacter spiritensis]